MALGRHSLMDSRRSSSSLSSTLTTVLLMCLCLLGLWMISTIVVPVGVPSTENNLVIKHEAFEPYLRKGGGSSGDVPGESSIRYSNDKTDVSTVGTAPNGDKNDDNSGKTTAGDENGAAKEEGEVVKEDSGEGKNGEENHQEISQVTSLGTTDREKEKKAETSGDENGITAGAEVPKEDDLAKVGGDENAHEESTDETSQGTAEKNSDDPGDGKGKTESGEESSQEITEKSSDVAADGNGKTEGGEESSQESREKSSDDAGDGNSRTEGGANNYQETTEKTTDDGSDGNEGEEDCFEETTENSSYDDIDGNDETQGGKNSSLENTEKNSDDVGAGNGKTQGGEVNSQETAEDSSDDSTDESVQTRGGELKGDQKNNEATGDEQDKSPYQQNPDDSTVNAATGNKTNDQVYDDVLPDAAQSELLNETNIQNGAWPTQTTESNNEKEMQGAPKFQRTRNWELCNVPTGADYIPCLDNEDAIMKLQTTKHYEHRERHCPDECPTCLVPYPEGYRKPVEWPDSRHKIWYYNVPHVQLASVKGRQNWMKVSGEYITFPGGGTQFKYGALHYIDFIQQSAPDIAWGKKSRVALDVGCGVASFGGYLFDRDTLTMSFAPKDEHVAQVQLALERGIPAIAAVMGTKRLPFPGMVFDVIHCARCRVPWPREGGIFLLEVNRLLRPGGYFVWSATPIYQRLPRDVEIWREMKKLTKSMCWEMVNKTKDRLNKVGMAIYRKPSSNKCYAERMENSPPLCRDSDDQNAAWNISLQACMHKLPKDPTVRGSKWPEMWPQRLTAAPYWLNTSQVGVYGKPAPKEFKMDFEHWKHVLRNTYLQGMGIKWSLVRNIMDMRATYGGFAAALQESKQVDAWVMNVVSIDAPDTLDIIYDRGLFGIYHNWCESFSTYPRSYDLLHADHLFSKIRKKCKILSVIVEVDRILRPRGYLIIRDKVKTLEVIENMIRSLHYRIRVNFSVGNEGLLCVRKTLWRPEEIEPQVLINQIN